MPIAIHMSHFTFILSTYDGTRHHTGDQRRQLAVLMFSSEVIIAILEL